MDVTFFISPTFVSGRYNVSVHTDYRNQVFELDSDGNNMRSLLITVQERLPNLVPSSFFLTIEPTIEGNMLSYSYMVQNEGSGDTIGAPWSDQLSASPSSVSNEESTELDMRRRLTELSSGSAYMVNVTSKLPQAVHGTMYLYISIDVRNQIVEENELDNQLRSTAITIEPLFPDLAVQSLQVVGDSILAGGRDVELEWTVINRGELAIQSAMWYDSLSLSPTDDLVDGIKLADVIVSNRDMLIPQTTYQQRVTVTLPLILDYSTSYNFLLQVNSREQFEENDRLENNIISLTSDISPPPSPDLMVTGVKYTFFPSSRVIIAQWTVRNVGNSMNTVMSWRDQVILSPDASFNSERNILLGSRDQSLKLFADQEYNLRESFFISSTLVGNFYIYVLTDASNSVMEIDGESNNLLRSESALAVPQSPTVILAISIDVDSLPSTFFTGQKFVLEYNVRNTGEVAVGATSWLDGVYLSNNANPSRSFLLSSGFLLTQTVNRMQLEQGETYDVSINVTLPHQILGQNFLAVLVDMNNVLNIQTVGMFGIGIAIEQNSLPDLIVNTITENLNLTSGQPATIDYTVNNVGESPATGLWYEALILSQDAELDPFDTRLLTVRNPQSSFLSPNASYNQSVEVFIPYDLPTSFYYIIIIIDVRNDLFEQSDDNNLGNFIVFIREVLSTDISILNVQVSPMVVTYRDDIDYTWQLRNNGSLLAVGYKCDSIYLSEDDTWDISDLELGAPQCSAVSVNAFNNDPGNDVTNTRVAVAPFVAQQGYYGIVRTRTNIRDLNIENNIGSSSSVIEVTAPSIELSIPTTISLQPNEVQVFRIDGVPGEETLVASLTTEENIVYHDLFLRYREVPTGAQHDAFSQFSLTSSQRAVVRYSRSGIYYLRVESFTNSRATSSYSVEILVRIARFEILEVAPLSVAPLGNVTFRIMGTVMSYFSSASLVNHLNGETTHRASRTYWFNSELVYATFDLTGAQLGNYSIRLTDQQSGDTAQLNNSITIATGIPGQLAVSIQPPRALRVGEEGEILVNIQNDGNTDLLSPHLVLMSQNQVTFRLLDETDTTGSSDQIDFLGLSLEGPAGILPPGARTTVEFRVAQVTAMPNRARYQLKNRINGSAPHPYVNRRSSLRPTYIPPDVWDTVWDNFLQSVGTTQESFKERLSEIASEFSLLGKRLYSVQEMVQFQLQVSFGFLSGKHPFNNYDCFFVL